MVHLEPDISFLVEHGSTKQTSTLLTGWQPIIFSIFKSNQGILYFRLIGKKSVGPQIRVASPNRFCKWLRIARYDTPSKICGLPHPSKLQWTSQNYFRNQTLLLIVLQCNSGWLAAVNYKQWVGLFTFYMLNLGEQVQR